MKNKFRFVVIFLALLTSGLVRDLEAAGKEGEWVRIPSSWLLHRFVRPSTAPAHTYKVALALPPGASKARVAQSSGRSEVDELAGSFAWESVQGNAALKTLAKTKELYFQFVVTPPMLDVKMRSKEGLRPPPPGKELYAPMSNTFFLDPNQNETSRQGELVVTFPPQGGYAAESIVTLSTGNHAVDRYFLHNSALNWQTTSKSSKIQTLRTPFGAVAPQRWQSILDH